MRFTSVLSHAKPTVTANVSPEQVDRLTGTSFRGRAHRLAGNFSRWNNPGQMLDDQIVRAQLLEHVRLTIAECKEQQKSGWKHCLATIVHTDIVGWDSTDDVLKYDDDDLEIFQPNKNSCARRVLASRVHLLAPQTKQFTIIYDLVRSATGPDRLVDIQTIHPGLDVGKLLGNVTHRTGRVYFYSSHPGA